MYREGDIMHCSLPIYHEGICFYGLVSYNIKVLAEQMMYSTISTLFTKAPDEVTDFFKKYIDKFDACCSYCGCRYGERERLRFVNNRDLSEYYHLVCLACQGAIEKTFSKNPFIKKMTKVGFSNMPQLALIKAMRNRDYSMFFDYQIIRRSKGSPTRIYADSANGGTITCDEYRGFCDNAFKLKRELIVRLTNPLTDKTFEVGADNSYLRIMFDKELFGSGN